MKSSPIRILIISYLFPPRGGVGVQRITKFVKYLPQHGFSPLVLTVEKPSGSVPEDKSLMKEIPENVEIFHTKSFEPYHIYRVLGGRKKQDDPSFRSELVAGGKSQSGLMRIYFEFQRRFLIPDPKIGWFKPAVREAQRITKKYSPELIFSTSPEATAHLIALKISKKTGIPFIADFRDPWIDGYYSLDRPEKAAVKEKQMEFDVINSAGAVTSVMESVIEGFKKNHQISNFSKFHVIPNGFDENDYKSLKPREFGKFTISHTGSIYRQRSPEAFFQTVSEFINLEPSASSDIKIFLMGRIDNKYLEYAHEAGIKKYIELEPFGSHDQSLEAQLGSDVLLLLSEGVLTAKIYEYLRARKPILGFAPNGELSEMVSEWGIGKIFNEHDISSAAKYLSELYQRWKNGKFPIYKDFKEIDISPYERANQAADLAKIMKNVISR